MNDRIAYVNYVVPCGFELREKKSKQGKRKLYKSYCIGPIKNTIKSLRKIVLTHKTQVLVAKKLLISLY